MTGGQAVFMLQQFVISYGTKQPDCYGDMLIEVVIVLIVTYLSWGTLTFPLMCAIAALQIMSIITREPLPQNVQYAMLAAQLIMGGYSAFFQPSTLMSQGLYIANVALTGVKIDQQIEMDNEMKRASDKMDKLKVEIEADKQKDQMQFEFNGYASAHISLGCAANPMQSVIDSMAPISSYRKTSHYIGHDLFEHVQS